MSHEFDSLLESDRSRDAFDPDPFDSDPSAFLAPGSFNPGPFDPDPVEPGSLDPGSFDPRSRDPRLCGTPRDARDEPRGGRLAVSQPSWGHSFADLLGNSALAGCRSLGLCAAGRTADAAVSAAQLGEWMVQASDGVVLVVEADLWRPRLAALLDAPTGPGLADTLLNPEVSVEQVVHPTRIARLNLLPAGRPLQGKTRKSLAAAFGSHFQRLCGRFPNVIVTLPSATDPECGSFPFSVPNAVLLVVQPQQTSVRDIQAASRRLREAGAALVGTVMDETAGALVRA